MPNPIPAAVEAFAETVGPEGDAVLAEMDEYADEHGFPTVGPAVGGWFQVLATMVDAERVFEFGSGYGYSAYWFARALPADGEIVLTEVDADELDLAREYLDRGDFDATAHFELGDAIETIEDYDGPFDVVLIDNEKHRYREAFEAVRGNVAPGGVVLADNAVAGGTIDAADVRRLLDGEDADATDMSRGIADYLKAVREAPGFETTLLPVGEGVAVSLRTG
ncbi:methyltransferase domain-containing protein [Halapricum sp. CBA1109]|uniref:O-methyltransferase n=1 Tax=Halapricum sp. CBA1109 TaxID=2668068 RepID=UPI0012F790AD|nr:O-methyltransferase [Halapricum sp. CBA1109]MUV89992.1 methyltransferase domain-containing protein [Halapricum sp. CBA1109]